MLVFCPCATRKILHEKNLPDANFFLIPSFKNRLSACREGGGKVCRGICFLAEGKGALKASSGVEKS